MSLEDLKIVIVLTLGVLYSIMIGFTDSARLLESPVWYNICLFIALIFMIFAVTILFLTTIT